MKYLKYFLIVLLLFIGFKYVQPYGTPEFAISQNFKNAEALYNKKQYAKAASLLETTLSQVAEHAKGSSSQVTVLTSLCMTYVETENQVMTEKRCEEAQLLTAKVYGKQSNEIHTLTLALQNVQKSGRGRNIKILY